MRYSLAESVFDSHLLTVKKNSVTLFMISGHNVSSIYAADFAMEDAE